MNKNTLDTTRINEFIVNLKQQDYAVRTIATVKESLSGFVKFLEHDSIENYRHYLIQRVKPATANLRIYCVNKYLKYIKYPYTMKSVTISSKKALEKVISLKDYNKLKDYYKANDNMEMYFAVMVLASTGIRPSELFKIRYCDITVGYADIYSKRNKQRRIFFPKALVKEMQSYYNIKNMKDTSNYIFNFDLAHLRYELRKGVKCGISRDVLYPYSFRHLYGKTFMKKSKNIALLADILGHESLETTRIYTRLTKEEQAQEVNKIVDWI